MWYVKVNLKFWLKKYPGLAALLSRRCTKCGEVKTLENYRPFIDKKYAGLEYSCSACGRIPIRVRVFRDEKRNELARLAASRGVFP